MIKFILIFFTCCFLFPVFSIAQQIEINVNTKSEPKAALGIFFTSGKVVEQPNTSFERINDNTVVVRMPYVVGDLPSASPFATAYLLTVDDDIVFGDVRMVSAADSGESFLNIPICRVDQTKNSSKMLLPEQLNYLESLLEVRNKKREVARKLLIEKMSDDVTALLQKWETRFGMKNDHALSAELSGLELVQRLTRLKESILLFRSTKEKNNPTAVATP